MSKNGSCLPVYLILLFFFVLPRWLTRTTRLKRSGGAFRLPPGAQHRFKRLPANCVWLKLEHSFKSEWLNTPGHLSLSLSLSFTGEPWCEWFWFCTAASVAQSLQSANFAQGAVKRMFRNKKKWVVVGGGQQWSSRPRSTGAEEEPRIPSFIRSCVFPWLTPVQRARTDSPISFRIASVTHSVRGTSLANRRQERLTAGFEHFHTSCERWTPAQIYLFACINHFLGDRKCFKWKLHQIGGKKVGASEFSAGLVWCSPHCQNNK